MKNSGIGTPYWYEWEIGIIECLKMMFNDEIASVVLQASEFQKLDDVVVKYIDGSIVNIQVKHTDVDDNLTYSFLSAKSDSVLQGLAQEWRKEKDKCHIREIQLITNKKYGTSKSRGKCSMENFVKLVYPKLKEDCSYCGENEYEKAAIVWFKRELAFLGDDMDSFIKVFSFRAELGLDNTEKLIKEQIKKIIGIDREDAIENSLRKILAELRIWATSQRKKQEITVEDIYKVMCSSNADIPQYELLPEKPIFPSRIRFAKKFIATIKATDKKIVFLQGLPGSGKTNFVSYLSQITDSIVDFRYYTYLPVNSDNPSYSDDEGFYLGSILWKSILVQLKDKFQMMKVLSKIGFPIEYQYLSVTEMRENVIKFLPIYSELVGRTCYFFIDGIDHAARSQNARNSFLSQIPVSEEIGDNVKFILVGQPINDKYPSCLINNQLIEYCLMPLLEQDDVIEILKIYKIQTEGIDVNSLANTIISVVGNNALNVLFAVMELNKIEVQSSFEVIEKALKDRCLNRQIDKYYEWIINSFEKNMLLNKIEAVFACASQKISLRDISQICDYSEDDTIFLLNHMYPLIRSDSDGYFVFHNDVRLHFKNEIIANGNYSYIVEKIEKQIYVDFKLERYKYDILYKLLLLLGDVGRLFELLDIKYIMQSVMFNISFDTLAKQFLNIMNLMICNDEYEYLVKASAISLILSQFANCISYYEKESEYVEEMMLSKKTKSEKYILDILQDVSQIIDDTYVLFKNELVERGTKLFNEYFFKKNLKEIIGFALDDKNSINKLGYIYRSINYDISEEKIEDTGRYEEFIDGWLEASSRFVQEEDIKRTFCFKSFYLQSLKKYSDLLFERGDIDPNAFSLFTTVFLSESTPISVIIELCEYGIFKGYPIGEIAKYISDNIEKIKKDVTYEFDNERILGVIKAWFCTYQVIETECIDKVYKDILLQARIREGERGYKPANAQKKMAREIFDVFFCKNSENILGKDTIFLFIYFGHRFGAGSAYDCNGYKVVKFLRSVFMYWAIKNSGSKNVQNICDAIIQCLDWEKSIYISEFNELFLISNSKDQFMELVEYWCGSNGEIWNKEYDEVEHCCTSISETLKKFGEYDRAKIIIEHLRLKIFGYVGRKDYSLIDLFEYYKQIPNTEKKVLIDGMVLLEISDAASDIGDNRTNYEINLEVAKNTCALGYRYLNALFELKNIPGEFIYWRMTVLNVLFDNINTIDNDIELKALYYLTNSWISARIEADRKYGRVETLKKYNSKIISKISDDTLRAELINQGNCSYEDENNNIASTRTYDYSNIIDLLKEEGYSEKLENAVILKIDERTGGNIDLLIEIKNRISNEELLQFTNKCVIKYIIKESKYGFAYTGVREIIKIFYPFIIDSTWKIIIESIIKRFSVIDLDAISNIGADLEIFTLGYILNHFPDKIESSFLELCDAHINLITANGRIDRSKYTLSIDKHICSLDDMVKYQLGNNK